MEAGLLQWRKGIKAAEGEQHQQICNFRNLGKTCYIFHGQGERGAYLYINFVWELPEEGKYHLQGGGRSSLDSIMCR